MKSYLSRHPEVFTIILFLLMVLLLEVFTDNSSRSQEPLTPDFQSTPTLSFRGIEPPNFHTTPVLGQSRRGIEPTLDHATISFDEDFSADSPAISEDDPYIRADSRGNRALRLRASQSFRLPFGYVENLRLTADIKVREGEVRFSVRRSGAGAYTVVISSDGRVSLNRANTEVAAARVAERQTLLKGTRLRITATGSRIVVKLGNEQLISFDDPQPLPYGVITFGSANRLNTRAIVDNLRLRATTATDLVDGWTRIQAMMPDDMRSGNARIEGNNRVYFTRTDNDITDAWSAEPSGANAQLVVTNALDPEISPEGRSLAFVSDRDGSYGVWVKDQQGLLTQVTPPTGAQHKSPTWAPDNVRVAYITHDGTTSSHTLDIIDLRTGITTTRLFAPPFQWIDWSPEPGSEQILRGSFVGAWATFPDETLDRNDSEVYIGCCSIGPFFGPLYAAYSPGGSQIAFTYFFTYEIHRFRIAVVDTPTSIADPPQTVTQVYAMEMDAPIGNVGDVAWNPASDDEIAFVYFDAIIGDSFIKYIDIGGTLPAEPLSTSISDATGPISWYGDDEFLPTYERCITLPFPAQGIALHSDSTSSSSVVATLYPPYRLELTGRRIDASSNQWLKVHGEIPDYATNPATSAYQSPLWVNSSEFVYESIYIDPCDDDSQINNTSDGNTYDIYYLPLLERPERTLTPTLPPTPAPICTGTTSVAEGATGNIRNKPNTSDSSVIATVTESGIAYPVTGKFNHEAPQEIWYQIKLSEAVYGWIHTGLLDVNETTWQCGALPHYDDGGDPYSTFTPSPTVSPTFTPTFGPSPTLIPRDVPEEAVALHSLARQLSLPLPFDAIPVVNPLDFVNGFGAYGSAIDLCHPISDACQYDGTYGVHTGLDFYTNPIESDVRALCDGIIIPGKPGSNGGSALPNAGLGLALRCFADEPRDADGDGKRNLSNIVLVYNHLSPTDIVNTPYVIVTKDMILGKTSGYNAQNGDWQDPHLHLEIFYAKHWEDSGKDTLINPSFLFSNSVHTVLENEFTSFGTVDFGDEEISFDKWWLQAIQPSANVIFWIGNNRNNASVFSRNIAGDLSSLYGAIPNFVNCTNIPANADDLASYFSCNINAVDTE